MKTKYSLAPAVCRTSQWFALFVAALVIECHANTSPLVRPTDSPRSILFVGNSYTYYNNGIPSHLRQLLAAAEPTESSSYELRMMTLSGARMEEYVGFLPSVLESRKWDVVVLQGQSAEPIRTDVLHFERFMSATEACDALIRKNGARTVLFMTWAYHDKPEMTGALADGYVSAGNKLDALVIPVGFAFQRALKELPGIVLHRPDKSHPTAEGTYLAACVFYAAFCQKSPVGLKLYASIEPKLAASLQSIAWEAVEAFYLMPQAK